MAIISVHEVAPRLCEALGLDANKIRRIVFDFDASQAVVGIYVQYIGDDETLDVLFDIIREAQAE